MIRKTTLLILCGGMVLGMSGCSAAQVPGCTDPMANNFSAEATVNDGSCTYDEASVLPDWSVALPGDVQESSGLLLWAGRLLTHNDNDDTRLYMLDTATGEINGDINLGGVENVDWEDLAQDAAYLYVGDFGNNADGSRWDQLILRVNKEGLLDGQQEIREIRFSYADQGEPLPVGPNSSDFDCEALISMGDSLYLFTKQWESGNSTIYALPKEPGDYVLEPRGTLPVEGLVTGATCLEQEGVVVLCGYNILLQPFLYLLYGFEGDDFPGGNQRKITIPLGFYQVEGIAAAGGGAFYLTNEKLVKPPYVNSPQQLHLVDLSEFF